MGIFIVFLGLTILGLICYGLQVLAVRLHSSNSPSNIGEGASLPRPFPPISILKPMRGLDDSLFDNLESFCLQDYPQYEIILCLQDYNDPACKVARKIKEKYRDRDISIVIEKYNKGLNPKVNNLIPAYKIAKYDHILISDSNVLVERDYLKMTAKQMSDPAVGLVTNIIRGVRAATLGSVFENLHLNSFIIGSVCLLDRFLRMPCVIGKSMLMRKSDLEAIGGFKSVENILAEDYIIGERIRKTGKRVVLSNYLISNVNEYWSFKKFLNRHTRWGKLRWKIGGIKYISELISNPVFMSVIPLFLYGPNGMTVSLPLFAGTVKILADLYLGRLIASDMNPLLYLLCPIKDIAIGIIWFVPLLSNTVVWRGNRYIIGKNSVLFPVSENSTWAFRYRIFDAIKARLA